MRTRAHLHRLGTAAPIVVALALVIAGSPARGAKWITGCPKPKQKLSATGKGPGGRPLVISRYYEHVGHTVTFSLRDTDVRDSGGFSTDPDGNTVEITFFPPGGAPIPLPAFPVTAASPDALTFVVPDTTPILGRLVVGPAHIAVKRQGVFMFEGIRQTILPPMNDVYALTSGADVEVLGAVDAHVKYAWVPISFGGFGTVLPPDCPALMTPINAFAVSFSLKKGDGQLLPDLSFGFVKKNKLFFGDFTLSGINLYGQKLRTHLSVDRLKGLGIAICALNDTFQLVMQIPLQKNADLPNSDILPIVQDGSPLVLKLQNITADPEVAARLATLVVDSAKSPCTMPTP